ncbi:hypothetical protein BBK82_19840 [Lentzea guizhouensis]|uniref:DUF418 domain-containing protein n=1 Tax=Lentzea guizhouensis TaxID=1586287 RepID=A0A1B2HYR8_9PSEU|nr:DUF418 domain-containing protein [Lentzea guizhouensis]ANZ42878.1 hypothetical protein BBK82_19840 [Lentzea guizhouensis]
MKRLLTPDLARGSMLALIALANSAIYLYGRPYGVRQHIVETDLVDRMVSVFVVTFVDARAYPMFALLFAYGVAKMSPERAKSRNRWLLVFGFVHAMLLYPGDVLGVYGLLGFGVIAMTRLRGRTLLLVAAGWLALTALLQSGAYGSPPQGRRTFFWSFEIADPLKALALHPLEWLMTPLGLTGVVAAAVAGVWAARHDVLAEPERHLALLRRVAPWGIAVATLGGVPSGLAVGGFWQPEEPGLLAAVHGVTGVAGGLGYAALVALVAVRIKRPNVVVRAVAACGERSLSCYLFQSVVFVVLLKPYTFGLGATLGSAEVAVLALATWLVSVLLADLLGRRNRPGPAETLLRKLRSSRV